MKAAYHTVGLLCLALPVVSFAQGHEEIWSCPHVEPDPVIEKIQSRSEEKLLETLVESLQVADVNSDGLITLEEASDVPNLLPDFTTIDANMDAAITPIEVTRYLASRSLAKGASVFMRADRNGDRVLTRDEVAGTSFARKDGFGLADTDNSGTLTLEELLALGMNVSYLQTIK